MRLQARRSKPWEGRRSDSALAETQSERCATCRVDGPAATLMNSSQPQRSKLPERDEALLSAYLDKQLSAAEQVSLERRLAVEPILRAELDGLHRTAAALRSLEQVRPPRSFTLDPATAPKPRFFLPRTWVMQMGSGFAGLALVLLATVQMLGMGTLAVGAPAPMAAKESPTTQATQGPAAAPMMAVASTAAPTMAVASTAAPMMGAAAAPAAAPMAPAAAREAGPVAQPTQEPTAAMVAEATTGGAVSVTAADRPEAAAAAAADGGAGGIVTNASAPARESAASGVAPPSGAVQSTDTSSPDTVRLPGTQAEPRRVVGLPPGLTLAIGVALIGLGVIWSLYSRRRG